MAKHKLAAESKPSAELPISTDVIDELQQAQVVGFPIVGIGASAGGLAAFEAFFSGMPTDADPDMAFVLVQHLAPDHKSALADLIQRYTQMHVFEVENGMVVRPNCVYIIPPNKDMALLNGTLQLLPPILPHGQRLPIDFLFRSLALDQRERAIGIVLSGTASDGTLGVRAIKGEGGMVMVQTPESTEFDGMPRSAIATGMVDYILPASEMVAQLLKYLTHSFGKLKHNIPLESITNEDSLKNIFVLLRAQTSHDFSQYKPSTINRRIERRMAVNQIEGLGNYVRFLQQSPAEIDALFNDMLIGVTNFFRDKEAFSALETQVIPKLFADKPVGSLVRVWVPGCSTGEEAYSIAILLLEHIETIKKNYTVQIFATDIDSRAIATARTGLYPVSIASDITPERLARFFTVEPGGNMVRVLKTLRDVLLFSEQDIIKDPPFSKLDLISCRNLMIYLNASLQKRLIPLFHYALNPDGILFLGNSEGVGEFDFLFAMLERKAKLYQRKENIPGAGWQGTGYLLPLLPTLGVASRRSTLPVSTRQKHPLRELTEKTLLQKMAPPSVLINVQGDILYQHGRIGMYMEPAPGEAGVGNVLRMAREGLRPSLDKALYQAASTHEMVQLMNLNIKTNGHYTLVNLSICPVKASHPLPPEIPLYLLIFEEAIPAVLPVNNLNMPATDGANSEAESIAALKLELRAKDEYLRSSNEEMEASNEELKSANEEMQSVNEEMQSTNEELETSREEMQSLNEELATVNVELQIKLVDLARANNDMNNLLAGTGIATVFVDHQMCILRFTPFASQIINLILSDVGRPVSHIASNLVDYPTLLSDVQAVLKTLVPKEVNVHTIEGRWYTMRILPYRTLDNVIEGAVITFVDITEMKKAYEEIIELKQQAVSQQREVRYQSVISALSEPVVVHARNGEIVTWNPAAERIFGLSGDEIRSRKTLDLRWQTIHEDGSPFLGETRPVQEVFRTGKPQLNATMGICKPSGEVTWVLVNSVPMFDVGDALPSAVVVSFEDITERKKIEKALRKAHELNRLAVIVRDAFDAVTMQDLNGRILAWNPAAEKIYGWSEAEALQMNARDRIPPQWQEDQLGKLVKLSQAEILQPYLSQRLSKNGELLAVSITSTALLNETGEIYAIATTERLISEVKNESPR